MIVMFLWVVIMACAIVELSFVILSSDFRFSFFVITLVERGFCFVEWWAFRRCFRWVFDSL